MAPISKENEVLTVPPETAAAVPAPTAARFEDTASRPQPVALEVPVTVNGARTVEGSDKREPFSETTKTVLVFGNGAVIRLASPVSAGQLIFLTNEKTKKEVVCQVVKSKNYKSVSGYVELEFTEPVVGFWGMRFPSDRIGVQTHAPAPAATPSNAVKSNPRVSAAAPPVPVSPAVVAAPKITEAKPPQPLAEETTVPQPRPVEVKPVVPLVAKPIEPSAQANAIPPAPVANIPEVPAIPAPSISASLASSVASLLSAPEVIPALTPSKPAPTADPSLTKPAPAAVTGENSTEALKLQAARLQEQLSGLLFSSAPATKPAAPVPAPDNSAISNVAAKVIEMAKPDSAPVKAAPPAKPLPIPQKSSLATEEVKIPSWLEPLARNAASPAKTQEPAEREKTKHTAEIAAHDARQEQQLNVTETESTNEVEMPVFRSLLPMDEDAAQQESSSGGSRKGILLGVIAATVLLAAGGGWYLYHPANAVRSVPAAVSTNRQSSGASSGPVAAQPAPQNSAVRPEPASRPNEAPLSKPALTTEPVPVTRDTTHDSTKTIPAAVTERVSRPAPPPEPKKAALGEVHLANPTVSRPESAQAGQVDAPTIAGANANAAAGSLESGLATADGKQPGAPEVPLPVGGDVKPAQVLTQVPPVYPPLARNEHVAGDVVIDALIDANGHVGAMTVISGPPLLRQAAKDALRQWKYKPATLDDNPVSMHLTVTVQFRMQ